MERFGFLNLGDAEEFVAHTSSVNCLKIGRKSSRVLVTGGEDHKVNLWAIGKPNAVLVSTVISGSLCILEFEFHSFKVCFGCFPHHKEFVVW